MGNIELAELLKLATAERLEIAERLLESVADDAAIAPLTSEERAFIEQRVREHELSPHDTIPWSEVRKALDA